MAAVREKTLTMAVPSDGTEGRHQPGDVIGDAPPLAVRHVGQRHERDAPRLTESIFSTASPTA